jgi:pimeloyl-ACP methyl ester carboxylesterase
MPCRLGNRVFAARRRDETSTLESIRRKSGGAAVMAVARITPELEMHYRVDDYTDPWRSPETVLMLHGNAESGAVWFGWVPHLARHYRIVRPDMRGFGLSTPMPSDYAWTLDRIVDDYAELLRQLGIPSVHLIGAKLGGTVARRFAARHPQLVTTLTVAGTPPPSRDDRRALIDELLPEFSAKGVEPWARRTMSGRLGSGFPPAGAEWWIGHMARTAASSQVGFMRTIPTVNIEADLPRIRCRTLVITTVGSALGSVETTRRWQEKIPDSRLLVLPGDSYHVAASDPDRCAQETLAFIRGQQ